MIIRLGGSVMGAVHDHLLEHRAVIRIKVGKINGNICISNISYKVSTRPA